MPRKTKKSAEAEGAAPQEPITNSEESQVSQQPAEGAAKKKAPAKKTSRKKVPAILPAEEADEKLLLESVELAIDGEAEAVAHAADTFEEAFESNDAGEVAKPEVATDAEPPAVAADDETEAEDEEHTEPAFPAKLERLQKILAAAGIASRRHAEELITEGRVQVNGKVVTELGTKADPTRDHIRVDGKLLQGAERPRYFMLNKPRGYVTTVSDPEGRPTVMEFFAKTGERVYPVGRLDYLSEGLLLMTNDGELANKLTRAASGVEKTYLVKVSGEPAEEDIEALRQGVRIDRGKPGEGRVRTAPARIRQVRQGDNPWYEVVLIEGRNRELRKMFEEIGHHVEKIRRVGYGPLVLDLEPGRMRELDTEELHKLRLAADGKWKPKPMKAAGMLPREAGRTVDLNAEKRRGGRKPFRRDDRGPQQERGNTRPTAQDRGRREDRGFGARREGDRGGSGRQERGGERTGSAARGGQRPYGDQNRERPRFDRRDGTTRPPRGEQAGFEERKPFASRGEERGATRGFDSRRSGFGANRGGAAREDRGASGRGSENRPNQRGGVRRGTTGGFGQNRGGGAAREDRGGSGQDFGNRPNQRDGVRRGTRGFGQNRGDAAREDRGASGRGFENRPYQRDSARRGTTGFGQNRGGAAGEDTGASGRGFENRPNQRDGARRGATGGFGQNRGGGAAREDRGEITGGSEQRRSPRPGGQRAGNSGFRRGNARQSFGSRPQSGTDGRGAGRGERRLGKPGGGSKFRGKPGGGRRPGSSGPKRG